MRVAKNTPSPTRLSIRVTPHASANSVREYTGGVLHLRLTAPPVKGAANAACCVFVADLLGVSKSQVSVVGGHKSREKILAIDGLSADELQTRLRQAVIPSS